MIRIPRIATAATAALLLAACPAAEPPEPAPGDGAATAPDAATPICLQGGPFVAGGAIDVRAAEPADAQQIGALRWERHDGCERFVVDLVAAGGSPAARGGSVTAELLRDIGVVRVTLHDIATVDPDATDTTVDGPLAGGAFAVFAPDGRHVYVDVHLADAAEASVTTLDEPARVVVDLRPGGAPVPAPAPRSSRVVVLQPRPAAATYPLEVTGYARTFEANVVVRIAQDGEDVYDDFTTATAWADAWGHFTFTIPEGPGGSVVLHVGEHSARDGTWEGVAVRLDMRQP